jgi:23S rRNA pseudouridine2605 synthase
MKNNQGGIKKQERIQKVLANLGYGSRRAIEELIKQKKITVNGKFAEIGQLLSGDESVHLNDEELDILSKNQLETRVVIYHKPEGEIVSHSDPKHQKNVFQKLPEIINGKWISVGRLDINTSGLLLITNDGDIANYMMHPSNSIDREYSVRIYGVLNKKHITNIRDGVLLEDGVAKVDLFEFSGGDGSNQWYRMILKEGKNREIRRIVESQNFRVSRLIRTRYGPIKLPPNMRRGEISELTKKDIEKLKKNIGFI